MTATLEFDPPIVLNAGEWLYMDIVGERVRWAVYDGEGRPDNLLRQGESRVVGNTGVGWQVQPALVPMTIDRLGSRFPGHFPLSGPWPHTLPVAWPKNDETPDP